MKRILLVDMNSWMGHHRPYFLLYTKILLDLNFKVDVLCLGEDDIKSTFPQEIIDKKLEILRPKLFFSQRILLQFIKFINRLNIGLLIPSASTFGLWWFVKNASIESDSSHDEHFVFFLDIQSYLVDDIPLFLREHLLPQAWAGLHVLNPAKDEFIRKCGSQGLIHHPSFKGLCFLNEHLVSELKIKFQDISVYHLPDVSYLRCDPNTSSLVLELKKVANGRKIVFLASLTKKHGLLQFLHLADIMSDSEILFFAMGLVRLDGYNNDELEYIHERLSNPPFNLLVWSDIYPPEETLNAIYKYSDAAFIFYPDFQGSSNKLTKAISLETPVLVADNTLLAERVRKYQLGFAVDPTNLLEMSNDVNLLLEDFQFDKYLRDAFVDYNSEHNLKSKLIEIIQ